MAKKSSNQIIGILLLIAALLMLVDIPFIDGNAIGILIIIGAGIYSLIKG